MSKQTIDLGPEEDSNDPQPWEQLLDDLLQVESGLRPRELEFIEDLDGNWRGKKLSEKQNNWLELIHDRLC